MSKPNTSKSKPSAPTLVSPEVVKPAPSDDVSPEEMADALAIVRERKAAAKAAFRVTELATMLNDGKALIAKAQELAKAEGLTLAKSSAKPGAVKKERLTVETWEAKSPGLAHAAYINWCKGKKNAEAAQLLGLPEASGDQTISWAKGLHKCLPVYAQVKLIALLGQG